MLNRRRNKNFFAKLSISSTNFIPSQRAKWDFNSNGLSFLVESDKTHDVVEYSFNGEDVHGDMTPLTPSEGIIFDGRFENNVWFRRKAESNNVVIVRVEAWQHEA